MNIKKTSKNGINLVDILLCPCCKRSKVIFEDELIRCLVCGEIFGYKSGVPVLLDKDYSNSLISQIEGKGSWEDYDSEKITRKVAAFSRWRKSLFQKLSPKKRIQIGPTYLDFIDKYYIGGNILELGGGPNGLAIDGALNFDINDYQTVDVIGDARNMCFQDNIFEMIISNSVLEHILDYPSVLKECARVLKKDGYILFCVPQVCGRHHSIDYHRWTLPGLKALFPNYEILDSGVVLGPGMFVAHLLSSLFEEITPSKLLNQLICLIVEWVAFPLRFLDLLNKKNKVWENYAHTIYIIAKKQ